MKTSIKKLQRFASVRHERRSQKQQQHQSLAQDELARATQDMHDMKDCYDRLLSAAAATANSVYEFSESLREMGDCLLEKTALNDDEASGKVLLMLGKVQFELQKVFDGYRSHIIDTITVPSESLLNELRIVEEMKRRCDEKRDVYEDLMKKQKDKGRLISSKGECFPSPHLQEAHEDYDEEANVFVFRMKSLKQGQSRSFLTQASRHHAAQLHFFKKALRSLETIEPHVTLLAEQLHIDYHFTGLKHDVEDIYGDGSESEVDYDTEDGSETKDNGSLTVESGQNDPAPEIPRMNRMEGINLGRSSLSFQRTPRAISISAPLFAEKKIDSVERVPSMCRPSLSWKFGSYVLPTPDETNTPVSRKSTQAAPNLWHSSPLDQTKNEKLSGSESGPKESSSTPKASPLPPPLTQGLSFKNLDQNLASHAKKARRQAFSGPLTGKAWSNYPSFSASGPVFPSVPCSGSVLRTPSTHMALSRSSTTLATSPVISELHELPLPPIHCPSRRSMTRSAHSGPLISRSHDVSPVSAPAASTLMSASTSTSTPLTATLGLSRSYSIPAGGLTERVPLDLGNSRNSKMAEDTSSPPP